jgi:hypothetical protein
VNVSWEELRHVTLTTAPPWADAQIHNGTAKLDAATASSTKPR